MESRWAVFGVSIILAASSALGASNSLTLYNTTSFCFFDAAPILEVDCYHRTRPLFSLVYIHRVFYGLTPLSGNCSASSLRVDCCPEPSKVTDEDCLLASVDQAAEQQKCDGLVSCSTTSMDRASVGEACPNMTSGQYFDFAFVEYGCVEDDLLIDVCDSSVTHNGSALFLESNFYDDQQDHSDKTCSCVVRTDCQQALVFEMLKVDLHTDPTDNETCAETMELTEGDPSTVLTSLNCTTGVLASLNRPGAEGGVVQSSSSVVNFRLHISATQTGSLLLGVTATDGAPVEVLCGQSSENVTECVTPPATTTTATTTTTESPPIDLSSPTYNSTNEACLHGEGSFADVFEFECPDGQGLISVERVFHGLTPQAWDCHASASKNSCCPGFDPARDCLFATEEGVIALRKSCDGNWVCFPKLERATVPSGACPPRNPGNLTYDDYSTFAFVEYSCINVGLVSDICDAGNTIRGSQVFLERNLHHFGGTEGTPTCSCVISTTCGHQLLVTALLLELFETSGPDVECLESVNIEDGVNSTLSVNLDCSSNEIDEVPTTNRTIIFQSQSNVVNFQLHLQPGNNKGKILLKIEATEEALVEVRCGRTTALPLWNQHQCIPFENTTAVSTTVPTITATSVSTGSTVTLPTSTESTTGKPKEDDRETIIVIVAVVVAIVVVIAFIVVIVVIVCRRKSTNPEPIPGGDDEFSVYYEPAPDPVDGYDTLVLPSSTDTYDVLAPPGAAGLANGEKPQQQPCPPTAEGAVGGVENPSFHASYDLDNYLNDASPPVGSFEKRDKF